MFFAELVDFFADHSKRYSENIKIMKILLRRSGRFPKRILEIAYPAVP